MRVRESDCAWGFLMQFWHLHIDRYYEKQFYLCEKSLHPPKETFIFDKGRSKAGGGKRTRNSAKPRVRQDFAGQLFLECSLDPRSARSALRRGRRGGPDRTEPRQRLTLPKTFALFSQAHAKQPLAVGTPPLARVFPSSRKPLRRRRWSRCFLFNSRLRLVSGF